MSDSSHVSPYVSQARPTTAASVSMRFSSAAGPSEAISSSVPVSFTNATVTCRCSASPLDTARCARSGACTYSSRFAPGTSDGGGIALAPRSSRCITRAPSRSSPSQLDSTAPAVSALSTISPADARSSSSKTRVASELEHVPAVALGLLDQKVEDARDPLHQLLGARPALSGQAFRQGSEPGDVDRDERALEHAEARALSVRAPLVHQAGQVGRELPAGRRIPLDLRGCLHANHYGQKIGNFPLKILPGVTHSHAWAVTGGPAAGPAVG